MHFSLLAFTASLAASAAARPAVPASHVLHEKRDLPPKKWVKRSRLDEEVTLPMRIGMTQSNLHIGDDLLMEVYVILSPMPSRMYMLE